jgi:hypothetical protein
VRYASGHVTFAFETMVFNLLLPTILLSVLIYLVVVVLELAGVHMGELLGDDAFGVIAAILNLYLFFNAGRRFYGCTIAGSAWRAAVAFIGLAFVLNAYRLLLFLATTLQVWIALGRGVHH